MMKDKLIDIHSHILFDLDDGSKSIEESLELLKKLKDVGFTDVILTPHYMDGSEYIANKSLKVERFNELKKKIKEEKLDINIFLGNEIYINNHIEELIKNNEVLTLNNSKYLLIEIPLFNKINNLENILYELKCNGFIPILAHPERYKCLQNDYKMIDSLKEIGIMFQSNYASILGYYGNNEKKLLKYLLKKNYIDFFGTDIHSIDKTFVIDNFEKIEKKIIKIIGEDGYQNIINNAKDIIKTR